MFSQQKRFTINWDGYQTISGGNYNIKIPAFNPDSFSYDFDEGLLFVTQWKVSSAINESSIKVSNVSYASVSREALKDL